MPADISQDGGIPSHTSMTPSPYETFDIYLASYLLSRGAILEGHERVGKRRTVFRFTSDETLHELLRLYWRRLPMPAIPADLFAALRRLKSLIRQRA
jgi:hypothetical protein